MSDPHTPGPLTAITAPVADEMAKFQNLPLQKKNEVRAYWGAFLVTACGYTAATLDATSFPREWLYGWAACGGLGLLLLVAGLRGARGPRDPIAGIFALAMPIGGAFAITTWMPSLWDEYIVRLIFVSTAAANVVRFWIAIRGSRGTAQKIVSQQIAQSEIIWRGVKRR